VWFSGAGWVRFEPTPRRSQISTPDYSTPPDEAPATDAPGTGASAAPEPLSSAAPADPNAVDRGADLDQAAGSTDSGGLSARARAVLLGVAALALLLALPAALSTLRRRRRWSSPGPLTAWRQVTDDAVDVGHTWRPADSPRAAAAYLVQERGLPPGPAQALNRLAAAAERARYARDGSSPAAAGADLHDDVRLVRSGLLAGASRRQSWTARLAPPSTLRWASAGLGSATADVLDRFDSAVSAVGERVRHPRGLRRRPAG